MLSYIFKRMLLMIPLVFFISVVVFFIIQLPPGDFMSTYAAQMAEDGEEVSLEIIEDLREDYGLDQPWYIQYSKWLYNIVAEGNFGYSFSHNRPVMDIIREKMAVTLLISGITFIFTYVVAISIGVYTALRQYSLGDYIFTVIGFLGMATPNFLLAIILMFLSFKFSGDPMLGIMSPQFVGAPMSGDKFLNILQHLVIPVIVIGTAGTSGLIRVMRAQILDELNQPYVITARAKGLAERVILRKYVIRAALNPIVSTIGWSLTGIFTGSTITAIVLNLPTQGPVMYKALISQDMYLAGTWLLFMAVLTVMGTLISDILLAWLDPRIRLMGKVMY